VESGVLPPSNVELNLLLEWPGRRTRSQWTMILAGSVAVHLIFLVIIIAVPGLLGERRAPVEQEVVIHHIPLYLPREVMTQRAPNREKISKQINLADLRPSRAVKPTGEQRRSSARRFEIPKQDAPKQVARDTPPQILPQAPTIEPSQSAAPTAGSPAGLPVAKPPPPNAAPSPFQDIGDDAPPNPHPSLTPPKVLLNQPIEGTVHQANGRQLSLSDDVPERTRPGNPGALDAPAQHAAVELQSDPSGADFKAYLHTILTIVRANWRKVIPESARMGTLKGRTVVEFIIDRDGSIPKLVTADSSGSAPLDRAAVAGLSMSNPLPPLPAGYKGLQVRLAFTFAYNMPTQ
jgi:TonB family protein